MKNIDVRFSILLVSFFGLLLSSCGPTASSKTLDLDLRLTGEMLFEGANSLQYADENQLKDLVRTLDTEVSAIQEITVTKVVIRLDDSTKQIAESLLLQVVSDNNEMMTVGTLNPIPDEEELILSLAESPSILSYLKDSGTTWVLDLNIAEDYMDEMVVEGKLTVNVKYIPNKN